MATKSPTTDIQELFSNKAITALSSIKISEAIQHLNDIYDAAFIYGGQETGYIPDVWSLDDRDMICRIFKSLYFIVDLSGRYDFATEYSISSSDAEKLYEIFEDESIFNNYKCLQLLEDSVLLHIYFRLVVDCTSISAEKTNSYMLYRQLKNIITGFLHPGQYFMLFRAAS